MYLIEHDEVNLVPTQRLHSHWQSIVVLAFCTLPKEMGSHQPNCDLQRWPSCEICWIDSGINVVGVTKWSLITFITPPWDRPMPETDRGVKNLTLNRPWGLGENQVLLLFWKNIATVWLLITFWYTNRSVSGSAIVREASCSRMEADTETNHCTANERLRSTQS